MLNFAPPPMVRKFHPQSFAVAYIGNTFSQRLLLGTKRSGILPLDVSLDMSLQI